MTATMPVVGRRVAVMVLSLGVALGACGDGDDASDGGEDPVSEVYGQDDERGYSLASRYDDLVWTAGHLPEDTSYGDGIAAQTDEVMEALEATLEEAGAGFDTVVMANVYLDDFEDWAGFNEAYTRYFGDRLPPRVTVEVASLAFGRIEISMVAHVRDR